MKVGIVICTDDRDTCFFAIRYAAFHRMENNDVTIYLVDSGLKYSKNDDGKYNLPKLLSDFKQSGGEIHKNKNREMLEKRLLKHFGDFVRLKQIEHISHNDKFQSIMMRDVYIRKFMGNRM